MRLNPDLTDFDLIFISEANGTQLVKLPFRGENTKSAKFTTTFGPHLLFQKLPCRVVLGREFQPITNEARE